MKFVNDFESLEVEIEQTIKTPLWCVDGEVHVDCTHKDAREICQLVKQLFADVRTPLDMNPDALDALELIRRFAGEYAADDLKRAWMDEHEQFNMRDAERVARDLWEKYRDTTAADFNRYAFFELWKIIEREMPLTRMQAHLYAHFGNKSLYTRHKKFTFLVLANPSIF